MTKDVEIERKYLLRIGGADSAGNYSDYATPLFDQLFGSVDAAFDRTVTQGTSTIQNYLPVSVGRKIVKELGDRVRFMPDEARFTAELTRAGVNIYYFNLKAGEGLSRHELYSGKGRVINFGLFDKYFPGVESEVRKMRLTQRLDGYSLAFDYITYWKLEPRLFIVEVEAPTQRAAKAIPRLGLDVTDDPNFKNVNLARPLIQERTFNVTSSE